ncbi:ATP-grasp domain-containing protein [Desulforhopalus sp. 52FAK]
MVRFLLVFWLIIYSIRYWTKPWNFFQLNHTYFNRTKNIFSKLDLDSHIPDQWRLQQVVDDGDIVPDFPVFVKPEWGQNSHGVGIARNLAELNKLRGNRKGKGVTYLLQEAATEAREFEFFYIRNGDSLDRYETVSLTETVNKSGESLVVNGINNTSSVYKDVGDQLSDDEREHLWQTLSAIGCFYIARVGLKADSIKEIVAGNFHVVEINIYLPMPLMLLDEEISRKEKLKFIRHSMKVSARLASKVDFSSSERCPIFFKKLVAHYKVKE